MHFGSILRSEHLVINSRTFILHTGASIDFSGKGHSANLGQGHGVTVNIWYNVIISNKKIILCFYIYNTFFTLS